MLDGGEGADLIGYIRSPEGVTINLETNTVSGGDAEGDIIRSIESVTGSRLSDVLIGNEGANTLRGFDGNDELFGKAGDDSLVGDAGADILDGGEGNDRLIGGEGNDVFIVGKSRDGDEILDFEIGVDIIELAVPLAPENIKISVTDGDTQIISVKDDSLLTVVRNVTGSIEVRAARIDSPEQDLAGNSFNEARHISTATDGKEYLAWVGPNDLEDFYSITLGATNDIDITLKENTDNLQLQLIDINGNVVIEANTTDAEPLSISQRIEPGAYRVRIASIGERDSSYILSLAAKPEIPGAPGITTTGSESVNYLFTQESIPLVRVDDFRSGNTDLASRPEFQGIDGRGFSIVVIDSGVDLDHPFFGPDADGDGISDRIIIDNNADFDFADSDQDPSDTNDHGSNVASIAVSSDPLTPGVAPASNLIPLKVFPDGSRFASDADIEQALQWVVSNVERFNIAAVNMSLGSDNITQAQVQNGLPVRITGGIDDEIAELVARGVIVASASGNGYSPFSVQGVAYPSADPNSLSVGAVWDRLNINLTGGTSWGPRFVGAIDNTTGADRITSYSQRDGNLSDIFAPGSVITGANATGGTVSGEGTSLATPHISGMAVLAQQLAQQECGFQLTQNDFRQRLRNSAIPIFDGDENGDGVVNGDEEDDNVPNTRLTFLRADMLNLANDIMQCDTRQTKVDLSAKQFNVVSSTVNTGENVTLNFEIQNTGLDDSEAFEVSFFLSENDNITQRDRLLGKYPVNRLKANSSTGNISTTFTLPDIMSPIWKAFEDGSGYIGIRVDSANQILETNENNNSNSDIKRDLERIVIQPKASVFITLNEFKGDFDDDTFGLFGPTNKSDFLGRTTINGKTWATKEYESNNNPKPNITYIRNVDSISIPIRVRLFDVDGKITCDELQRIKDLKMNLNLFTGELSGDVTRDLKNLQGARNAVINDFSEIKFTIGLDVPSDNETPDAPPILTGGGC